MSHVRTHFERDCEKEEREGERMSEVRTKERK